MRMRAVLNSVKDKAFNERYLYHHLHGMYMMERLSHRLFHDLCACVLPVSVVIIAILAAVKRDRWSSTAEQLI